MADIKLFYAFEMSWPTDFRPAEAAIESTQQGRRRRRRLVLPTLHLFNVLSGSLSLHITYSERRRLFTSVLSDGMRVHTSVLISAIRALWLNDFRLLTSPRTAAATFKALWRLICLISKMPSGRRSIAGTFTGC